MARVVPTDRAIADLAESLSASSITAHEAIGGILLGEPHPAVALNIFARLLDKVPADIANELKAAAKVRKL